MKKFFIVFCVIIVLLCGGYVYWRYFFVFAEGVKTGVLNFAVYKGNIFKTYEGKLIQQGFGSQNKGPLQSYEFEFSIKDKKIFDTLEVNSGKVFDLHYIEYHGRIPWRGNTVYIVDSILAMRNN
ncbi:hypothetical protein A9P82_06360 [Arachidicoccus ginsenosidimutans]|uniref:hypothetical protein n=1 Tax=Arachidicoccus sp. BS20 TaxID=1850526 RepID=UPI0007F1657D|nr:hypothetical protein [Arachidicoccus sp. BS20]ANI88950.1 hypothetical protein A9P82_06360 [Arachidicoccus sp. BS20]